MGLGGRGAAFLQGVEHRRRSEDDDLRLSGSTRRWMSAGSGGPRSPLDVVTGRPIRCGRIC